MPVPQPVPIQEVFQSRDEIRVGYLNYDRIVLCSAHMFVYLRLTIENGLPCFFHTRFTNLS